MRWLQPVMVVRSGRNKYISKRVSVDRIVFFLMRRNCTGDKRKEGPDHSKPPIVSSCSCLPAYLHIFKFLFSIFIISLFYMFSALFIVHRNPPIWGPGVAAGAVQLLPLQDRHRRAAVPLRGALLPLGASLRRSTAAPLTAPGRPRRAPGPVGRREGRSMPFLQRSLAPDFLVV